MMKKTILLAAGLCLLLMLLTGCSGGAPEPAATPAPTLEPTAEPTPEPTEAPTATPEPTAAPEPTQPPAQAAAAEPVFILPEGYAIGDPLPVYAAVRGDYQARLEPGWFTDAELVSDETHYNGLVYVRSSAFADGGYFSACEDNYQFCRYKDTNTWRTDLRGEVMRLAEFTRRGGTYVEIEPMTLEKEALHGVTLEGARAELEGMLQKTVGGVWEMETALDMDEARIHQVGEAYNEEHRRWDDDLLDHGYYYPAFSELTEEDECYYLKYRYIVNGLPAYYEYDWFGAEALISADGIEQIDLHAKYMMGDLIGTPDQLLTPQEIIEILPKEMKKYRFGGKLHSVISLELIYSVQEDEASPTGYVMAPAWYIIYLDQGAAKRGYTCQAVFSAVDGTMIQSMFDERPGG